MDGPRPPTEQITAWLADWRAGDPAAPDRLFAVVYPELERMASRALVRERPDHTLEPGALVNELYMRLVGGAPIEFADRGHFYAVAAQTMRRILIDHARGRKADKRGGDLARITLSDAAGWSPVERYEDVLAFDGLLSKLAVADPRAARVVELRFFGGLLEHEIAGVLGVAPITVKRDWKVARAWLMARLQSRR